MKKETIIQVFIFLYALLLIYLASVDLVILTFSLGGIGVGILIISLYYNKKIDELEEGEKYYRVLVEKARDSIIIIQNEIIKYANPFTEEILGYEKGKLNGKRFLDIVAEDTVKNVFFYETNLITKSGYFLPVEIHITPVHYKGRLADMVIMREIRTRKKVEEVFQYQEERFHALAENTPDIISRFDEECRYLYVNPAAEKEFGINKEDFFWKTIKNLGLMGKSTSVFNDAVYSVFKTKKRKSFYNEVMVGEAKKYYYTILIPELSKSQSVNSVLSITRDITEIREIDQVKSEFISITSHQLRSPLSIINWCSLSLLRGEAGKLKEEQKDYLEKIYNSTKKLIKITDAFINTTMMDLGVFAFNPKNIDIVTIVKNLIATFGGVVKKKNIKVKENYDDIPSIRIDSRVLKIIFRGLFSNALEYTPSGGKVSVSLLKDPSKEEIILKISDSGCGVSGKDKEHIFTKFFRSKEAKNMKAYGTGLDLYLIRSILGKLGGSIRVESPNPEFGKGTAFYVRIPVDMNDNK